VFQFKKKDRLTGKKNFQNLFENGYTINNNPIRAKFLFLNNSSEEERVKIALIVPKKNLKKAVQRNRIKRLIKEAYRLNSHIIKNIAEQKQTTVHIAFIYQLNSLSTYKQIEEKIIVILQRLKQRIESNSKNEVS